MSIAERTTQPEEYIGGGMDCSIRLAQVWEGVAVALSKQRKEAMQRGRQEARVVKQYLQALDSEKVRRRRSPEQLKERVRELEERISQEGNPLRRLQLVQDRIEAEKALTEIESEEEAEVLEEEFKQVVASYSERKGISYRAWRELGVPAKVLREGGVSRGR